MKTEEGQEDVASKMGNTTPARLAPPGTASPRGCESLVEFATEHGWRREQTFVATGWKIVKRKGPPQEEGRQYSMLDTRVEVEQHVVRLARGRQRLALIWIDGSWECALSNNPMGKHNSRTVRTFIAQEAAA